MAAAAETAVNAAASEGQGLSGFVDLSIVPTS